MPAIANLTLCKKSQPYKPLEEETLSAPMTSSIWPLFVEVQAERRFLEKCEASTVDV